MFQPGQEYEIETVRCPFDPAHFMPKSSFIRHIERCKSVNKWEFKQCPYDVYHIVKKKEYDIHLQTCKSKKHLANINESHWGDCDELQSSGYGTVYDEEDTVQRFRKKTILTESIVKGANNFEASCESDLVKAIQLLKVDQQDQDCQYWIDTKQQQPKALSKKPDKPLQAKKVETKNVIDQKVLIEKIKAQLQKKKTIKVSSSISQSCVGQLKTKQQRSFVKQPANALSSSFHPDMKIKPSNKLKASQLYPQSQLSRSGVGGYPLNSQYPPGYYGHNYNVSLIQNGYFICPYSGHQHPCQVGPKSQQMPSQFYPSYNQSNGQYSYQNHYAQKEKQGRSRKQKEYKNDSKSAKVKEKKVEKSKE